MVNAKSSPRFLYKLNCVTENNYIETTLRVHIKSEKPGKLVIFRKIRRKPGKVWEF